MSQIFLDIVFMNVQRALYVRTMYVLGLFCTYRDCRLCTYWSRYIFTGANPRSWGLLMTKLPLLIF